jgi:cytoskeletal protein CcmA (bactofilin family)
MALAEQPMRKDDGSPRPESRIEPPQPARLPDAPRAASPAKPTESVLAAGLTVEGKIGGNGHLRVAGRFTGNIDVKGELTIEPGAGIHGEVKADTVLVGGEVRGNVTSKSRVDLSESGVLIGDLKAVSLTVAAGSKMRGQAEFGWKEGEAPGREAAGGKPAR